MRPNTIPNVVTAVFFFALALLFAAGFLVQLVAPASCGGVGQPPCGVRDTSTIIEGPLMVGFAVLCFGLGMRVIWGMRHGED